MLRRNAKRFRGGLVFKAPRLLYHSILGSRVTRQKRRPGCASLNGMIVICSKFRGQNHLMRLGEGHKTRRCRRVIYPESYITKYTTYTKIILDGCADETWMRSASLPGARCVAASATTTATPPCSIAGDYNQVFVVITTRVLCMNAKLLSLIVRLLGLLISHSSGKGCTDFHLRWHGGDARAPIP